MMTCFYSVGPVWQIVLLVLSMFSVGTLTGACVFVFWYRRNALGQVGIGAVLLLNAALYVIIQIRSCSTEAGQALHRHIPYVVLFLATLLSLGYAIWAILNETKNRRIINNTSIKESFDNLPTGVCFFNEKGLPVLCNRAMYRFCFAVCGKDVQFITDLKDCLSEAFVPIPGAVKDGKIFTLSDGSAWQLETRSFTHENGKTYTQYFALDVTELQQNYIMLTGENAQLRKVQADLKLLSANVVAATREEEILNTKMRVHDEMGRCLMAAQKYLKEGSTEEIPESVVTSWQRAVSMLKYSNDTPDEDMLLQIRKTCESVKLTYVQNGTLPDEENAAYILTCAVRECVTNAVRYAEASALYVVFSETENDATVSVSNNGKQPDSKISEGGGLSTLRRRVECAGGTMAVQSIPQFKLTVTVPKGKEGML